MSVLQTMALLAAECATRAGTVPDSLADAVREAPTYVLSREAFILRLPNGLKFHYRKGDGVVVERPDSVPEGDVAAFLNGSVYGAVAWLNGLVPLHASAVVHEGRAYAFTGHSGAGKSTLATALGSHGMPMMTDDVLVLDLTDPAAVMCLPGPRKLKLWPDAVKLTQADVVGPVRQNVDKLYAQPATGFHDEPLPLAELFFLDDLARRDVTFTPVTGTARFTHARGAFYRPHFCNAIAENRDLFGVLSRIATQVAISRFDRPRDRELFAAGVAAMAAHIRGG